MRIIPYLILLIFVSFMIILPVSAETPYYHEENFINSYIGQTSPSQPATNGGSAYTSNSPGTPISLIIRNVENMGDYSYVHTRIDNGLTAATLSGGRPDGSYFVEYTNGYSGWMHQTTHYNILGQLSGITLLIFIDDFNSSSFSNYIAFRPSSIDGISSPGGFGGVGSYRVDGALTTNAEEGQVYAYMVYGSNPSTMINNPLSYQSTYLSSSITTSSEIKFVLEQHPDLLNLWSTNITINNVNAENGITTFSASPNSTDLYKPPVIGSGSVLPHLFMDTLPNTVYIISEIPQSTKVFEINLQGTEPTEPPEPTPTPEIEGYTVNKINQPPHYVGGQINYKLEVDESKYPDVQRVSFATNYQGRLYDSRTFIRKAGLDTFSEGGLGDYTFDQLLYYFEPDRVGDYTTTLSVTNSASEVQYSYSNTITGIESPTSSYLRLEVRNSYDNQLLSGSNLTLSWNGEERVNQVIPFGVYEGNIPKNTVITADVSKDGYTSRTVQGHFTDDAYNNWLIVLHPTEEPQPQPSESMVNFQVTDGINYLPNARILFNGVVKYTNQEGFTSYITSDIGLKTYSITLTGYQGATGTLTTIANTTITKTVVLTPLSITPTITPTPPITPTPTPSGNITYPALGEEGWGIISAIKYLVSTFLGVTDEKWIDAFIALCIIITSSIVVVQYTRDAGGAAVGGGIGFLISVVLGLIPLWIVFVMFALGGFTAFLMMSRGG